MPTVKETGEMLLLEPLLTNIEATPLLAAGRRKGARACIR